ncbi:MAG: hypothetical protein WBM54_06730 [Woeseia sp.]
MTTAAGGTLPKKLRIAVFAIFSTLTIAVIASEAQSQDRSPQAAITAAPALQQSLLVSRVSEFGLQLLRSARR